MLDLDDTLVKVVGDARQYISKSDSEKVGDRVRELKDGRKVVITERVHDFLEWAHRLFEISVCSLGEQSYVDMVVAVLDPNRNLIRGITYSARGEYQYITEQSLNPKEPPKDIKALFPYCIDRNITDFPIDPIILDDNVGMWQRDQQDNIIVRQC